MRRNTVLVILMVIAVLLCSCGASKFSPIEDFEYEMVDGEVIITKYVGTDLEIYIPEEINDRPVTTIGEGAFKEYDMTSILFPDTLVTIESNAFSGCNCLTEVILPDSVKRIEAEAFWWCKNLEDVNLPEDLEFLGRGAFGACESLLELEIPHDFEGFQIDDAVLSYESSGNSTNFVLGKKIMSPVSDHTTLIVDEASKARKLLEKYGYDEIEYRIKDVVNTEKIKDEQATPSGGNGSTTISLIAEERTYNSASEISRMVKYEYDDKGNILSESWDIGDACQVWNDELQMYEYVSGAVDGSEDRRNVYTYDEQNRITSAVEYFDGQTQPLGQYSYTTYDDGNVHQMTETGGGHTQWTMEYIYDTNGRISEIWRTTYLTESTTTEELWRGYTYDEEGRLIEIAGRQLTYGNDRLVKVDYSSNVGDYDASYSVSLKYGETGQVEEIVKIHADGEQETIEYIYDEGGNVERKICTNGIYRSTIEYTYITLEVPNDIAEKKMQSDPWSVYLEFDDLDELY